MKSILVLIGITVFWHTIVMANNKNMELVTNNETPSATIKGHLFELVDGEKVALPFANVFIEGTTELTTTDFDGSFKLNSPANSCKVKCTYKGYKSFEKQIILDETKNINLEIVLLPNK